MTDSCDSIWDLLSLYADGMAGVDDSVAVERHVAGCESCSRDLAFMRGTSKLIATAPAIEPPSSLHNAIMAATVERQTWLERLVYGFRRPVYQRTAIALAGAAAAIVIVARTFPIGSEHTMRPASVALNTAHSNAVARSIGDNSNELPNPNRVADHKTLNPKPTLEPRTRTSTPRIERAIALQSPEAIETPLFTSDSANLRKPPTPGSRRVIAKLNRPKNDPKTAPSGAPIDVNPPMEPLTSPAPPMTMPDGMAKTPNVVDPGVPAIKNVPTSGGKITLMASNGMSATAAASLAGLRGSLQNQHKDSERSISSAVYRPNETKQVTLDLLKSKF
jgi:hypothetical protein